MSLNIPVFGAQDKDVRPDTEESCLECLQYLMLRCLLLRGAG